MKKVLIPTDFSETALNAAAYAIELLGGSPCEFCLFHSYKVPQSVGVLISVAEILEQETAENLEREVRALRDYLKYPQVHIETLALPGALHEVLPEVITSQEADLLVMGTRGANGLADTLLGTHTARLIAEIKCPMLVVPSSQEYEGMKALVFACDRKMKREEVNGQWDWVDWLRQHYKPKFTTLHIENPSKLEMASTKATPVDSIKAVEPLPATVVNNEVKEVVYSEDVIEGLTKYIDEHQANMMVLVAHQYGWLGRLFHQSVTQRLAMKNLIPLLIFHD